MDRTFMECKGYTYRSRLGEGMFGKVVRAYSALRRKSVAIKIIDTKKATSNYREKFLPHERLILKTLNHPHVVKTYDIFQSPTGTVYMVMELCTKGDLLKHISVNGVLDEPTSLTLFQQLCMAVQYLHDKNVVHRDLKCENLLLDAHQKLKVSDFGLSKTLTYVAGEMVLSRTYCGTLSYAAPEILKSSPYNPKMSDVWSMGIVLYMMFFGVIPFKTTNVKSLVKLQLQRTIKFPPTPSISLEAKELIRGILHPDVTQRLVISRLLWSLALLLEPKQDNLVEASAPTAAVQQQDEGQQEESVIDVDAGEGSSTAGTEQSSLNRQ